MLERVKTWASADVYWHPGEIHAPSKDECPDWQDVEFWGDPPAARVVVGLNKHCPTPAEKRQQIYNSTLRCLAEAIASSLDDAEGSGIEAGMDAGRHAEWRTRHCLERIGPQHGLTVKKLEALVAEEAPR